MLSCYNTGQQVPAAYGGFQVEAMSAHGGWLFSARDLVRLALAADGFATRPDVLSKATLQSMTQPSAGCAWYAKGWMVNGTWWHTGQLDGTASLVARTASGYTWVILVNTSTGSHRLGLLKAGSPSRTFPLDGTTYPVGSTLADGTVVAVNGPDNTFELGHLNPQLTHYARVVEYRQDASTGGRLVYTLDGNPVVALPGGFTTPQYALDFSNTSEETIEEGAGDPAHANPRQRMVYDKYFRRIRRAWRERVAYLGKP